jgi:hypothetical protein
LVEGPILPVPVSGGVCALIEVDDGDLALFGDEDGVDADGVADNEGAGECL